MKKFSLSGLSILFLFTALCQEKPNRFIHSKEEFIIKSRQQQRTAWGLLAGGTALAVVGFTVSSNKLADGQVSGAILLVPVGALTALYSLKFFAASARSKHLAMEAVGLKMQKTEGWRMGVKMPSSYPAMTVSVTIK